MPGRALLALLLVLLALAAPARAQEDFTITGVRVDVAAPNADTARKSGWRLAQRKAWPQLYARLTGAAPAVAPKLGDGALDSIVSGIEVQKEFVGPNRYIATLAVAFDRARASGYLGSSARLLRSAPMLLLPVEIDGGTKSVFESRGPWAEAWRRFRADSSPIVYVRPPGTASDQILLTGWQAYRPNRDIWRAVLGRYAAANVLVAEVRYQRSWPGGPVVARFRAMAGPDNHVLDSFSLQAGNAEEFRTMLDTAIERIDASYTTALRNGELRADEDLIAPLDIVLPDVIGANAPTLGAESVSSITVTVPTQDEGAVAAFEAAILGAQGVQGAAAIGGNQIRIDYRGSLARLRYDLDQADLRLDGNRLRQRLNGEALLPPPVEVPTLPPGTPAPPTAEDVGGESAVSESAPAVPPRPAPPAPQPRPAQTAARPQAPPAPPSTPATPAPRDLTPPALRPEEPPRPRPGA